MSKTLLVIAVLLFSTSSYAVRNGVESSRRADDLSAYSGKISAALKAYLEADSVTLESLDQVTKLGGFKTFSEEGTSFILKATLTKGEASVKVECSVFGSESERTITLRNQDCKWIYPLNSKQVFSNPFSLGKTVIQFDTP